MIQSLLRRVDSWSRFAFRRREQVFADIYRSHYWGSEGSVSGPGSRPDATRKISAALPELFDRFGIKSILDAPCGDFVWMKDVVASTGVDYVGADIVPELVVVARENAGELKASFGVLDIVVDPVPECDLWMCRDCLFHLDQKSVFQVFGNFARSNCAYFLITNHPEARGRNRNIVSGHYRDLNMFKHPYSLPEPIWRFDDTGGDGFPREMILFDRRQVQDWLDQRGITWGSAPKS